MSLIVLKNIKKEYGKNQVLFNDLSLEIEQGEFVGLIGKSGAGKTTLLNIIGLITNISAGTITDRKSTRLNSSHVSSSYAVFCLKKKKERRGPVGGQRPGQSLAGPVRGRGGVIRNGVCLSRRRGVFIDALRPAGQPCSIQARRRP